MERMTAMDASFLYTETATMHMHVVGVLVLDPTGLPTPVGIKAITTELDKRLHLMAPLRRRMMGVSAGIDHPVWIEDPDFDVSAHVRPAPLEPPVTWAAVERFTGEVASTPLDRRRPLWEMWVVEGLEDGTIALVTKMHHAMMDGGAGGDLMASLFDLSPDDSTVAPQETPWQPDTVPSRTALVVRSVKSLAARQREVPPALIHAFGNLAATVNTWSSQRRSGTATPLFAPRTVLNGAITSKRSVSLTRVDLDVVRHIRRVFGTTVNDVVLAATATSLRRYLQARGGLPSRPLIAAVPVSTRTETSQDFGNRVSSMMVPLDLAPENPVQRLEAVHAAASSSKALHAAFGPQMVQELAKLVPPTTMRAAARLYTGLKLTRIHPPVMNVLISNVPGPPIDLYCAGTRVVGIFPMGPLIEGTGLNITVLSEAHHLNVGVMACPDVIDDVEEVGAGFTAAVAELERLALRTERRASGRKVKGDA